MRSWQSLSHDSTNSNLVISERLETNLALKSSNHWLKMRSLNYRKNNNNAGRNFKIKLESFGVQVSSHVSFSKDPAKLVEIKEYLKTVRNDVHATLLTTSVTWSMKWRKRAVIKFLHTLVSNEVKTQHTKQTQRCSTDISRDRSSVNSFMIMMSKPNSSQGRRMFSPIGEKNYSRKKAVSQESVIWKQPSTTSPMIMTSSSISLSALQHTQILISRPLVGPSLVATLPAMDIPKKLKKCLTCLLIVLRQLIAMK